MKKELKIGLLVTFFLIIIFILISLINPTKKYSIDNIEQIAEYEYISTIKCEAFKEDIKYFNYNNGNTSWLVTENNDVYIYNTYNMFSNNTHCKKIDTKYPEVKGSWKTLKGYNNYFDENYDIIGIEIKNNNASINSSPYNIYYYESTRLKFEKLAEYGYTKVQTEPPTLGIKGDNNIYGFYLEKDMDKYRQNILEIIIDYETIEFSVPEDEIIIDFYYTPNIHYTFYGNIEEYKNYNTEENMLNNFILTDKSYYRYQLIDKSCKDYLDIECEYELKRDEELSKYKDYILYRNNNILITKNGRIFYTTEVGMGV